MTAHYIGIMSGTSVDAVDGVIVEINENDVAVKACHSAAVPPEIRDEAIDLIQSDRDSLNRAFRLGNRLSGLYAEVINQLRLQHSNLDIRASGCHGQTLRHYPDDPHTPFTIQVVNGAMVAIRSSVTCVTDFRNADIALGGQGAPLAPAFHAGCFRKAGVDRVVLNLGGIANVTFLPGNLALPVTGFDTGPANTLMDLWVRHATGNRFDDGGKFAESGQSIPKLHSAMLADPYFRRPPPKSTGREYFGWTWLEGYLAAHTLARPEDIQATLLEVSADSITEAIVRHFPSADELFVCGGGYRNLRLMARLGERLPQAELFTTAALGIEPEWVEAAAFAWLAHRRLHDLPGNLPTVTGATRPAVLGAVYHP